MKSLLNLFFTIPSKIIISVIFLTLSVVIADCQVGYFTLFKQDNDSFINAITQIDNFNYETSRYYKNSVRKTVENITLVCMDYSEVFSGEASVEELLKHYNSIGDTSFPRIYEHLAGMKGLRFALVNHDRKIIYSNIKEINGLDSSKNIRNYFGEASNGVLIARSCENPYFATDAFIDFAEDIRECAEKYGENFDLYISFGDETVFKENEAIYEKLHFAMREKIEKLNDTVLIHSGLLLLCSAFLLTVTGKHEKGGKTYPTIMNRLPNDLLVFMYGTVLVCLSSLYRTALGMLLAHGDELDTFWFARTEDFYTSRIKFCVVIFLCTGINILCILKRQYKMGTLLKNTYLYPYVESIKKLKKSRQTPEKGEK